MGRSVAGIAKWRCCCHSLLRWYHRAALPRAQTRGEIMAANLRSVLLAVLAAFLLAGCRHENIPPGAGEPKLVSVPALATTTRPAHTIKVYVVADEGDKDEVDEDAVAAMAAPSPDNYSGKDRKASKLSIS